MTTWNDTDIPLAFLTTFRTYGTWLHGDKRGSIDRFHNVFRDRESLPIRFWNDSTGRSSSANR
ncbi:MAG: hypothetical protein M3449_04330 [Acidobacteriota bacterium]|nr:hypothetical protein [Acidobacteriota bacterium]